MSKSAQVVMRVEPELSELIDELVREYAKRGVGLEAPSRSAVMRTALARGLAAMKAELGAEGRRKRS